MWFKKTPALLLGAAVALALASPAGAQFTTVYDQNWDDGSPHGWKSVDLTAQPVHFSVTTYAQRGVVWCGEDYGSPNTPDPGYGNGWEQYLSREITVTPDPFGNSFIAYTIHYDLEENFDWLFVEVSTDGGVQYQPIRGYTGKSEFEADADADGFVFRADALDAWAGQTIHVRFRISTDGGWSDADGLYASNGAFRLDEAHFSDPNSPPTPSAYTHDEFESGGYGHWEPSAFAVGGSYRLVQTPGLDACASGQPGSDGCMTYPWLNDWSWVAYQPETGPLGNFPLGVVGWTEIAIESPEFTIDPDPDGNGIVDEDWFIQFDVYADLPLENQIFYTYQIAAYDLGETPSWWRPGFIYYGNGPLTFRRSIRNAIDATDTRMMVRLIGLEKPTYFTPNGLSTPAPFFDNVGIEQESLEQEPGAIAGTVTSDSPSPGSPLYGVKAYVTDGTGSIVAFDFTDENGHYEIPDLDPGDYTVSVVAPLGYAGDSQASATVVSGETTIVDFAFTAQVTSYCPRTIGYWKHCVLKSVPGQPMAKAIRLDPAEGSEVEGTSPVCDYLDLIEAHFNGNLVNEVAIYMPPSSGSCTDKLAVAADLLNLHGAAGMEARAKQQLMAVLLNVASGCLPLTAVISADGAVVSQAVTFCDNVIDQGGDLELAKDIADYINNGMEVPAGWIPLETPVIAYARETGMGQVGPALAQNLPNPFRSATTIRFRLPEPGSYTLSVFSLTGALVRSYTGWNDAVETSVTWDGRDGSGVRAAPGIYYYRLDSSGFRETKKALLLH